MHLTLRASAFLFSAAIALAALDASSDEVTDSEKGSDVATEAAEATEELDAIEQLDAFIAASNIDKSPSRWKTRLPKPPKATFDAAKTYYWLLDTSHGNIKIKLFPNVAPMHVSSTIYLTRLGFYDDLAFHRVIPGFMAQGGDPLGNGRGGPGYKYAGEYDSSVKHNKPGILSMANTGQPRTDGSQFFLTFAKTPNLNGRHTVFGEVVEGMGTLKELEKHGSSQGRTSEPLSIKRARIAVE